MKTKLKIKSVEEHTDVNFSPVLAHFQHGILQPGSEEHFSCIRTTKSGSKSNLLMAANSKNLYKGFIGEATDSDLVNTFVAIRSKTTNKIRLIQVQECSMISTVYDAVDMPTDMPNISKDVYFKKFGGKRGSSYFDKVEKQKMNVDLIKDDIEKSLINIDEKKLFIKELDLLKANHEADLLPPMNSNTGTVDEIYNLKEILTVEVFKHLEVVAQALLIANLEELPVKCEYVLKRIKNIQLSKEPDSPANINKLKICVYLDALSNLMGFGRKMIDSKTELSGLSSPVEEHIRNNFKQAKSSFQNSSYTQAKAHCYFIILAFMLTDDYTLDMKELVRDTKLDKQSVIKYGLYCGANLDSRMGTLVLKPGKKRNVYEAPKMRKGKKQ